MKQMRYPAVPLVTHTPYFNLWSMDDVPNRTPTCHWTGKPQVLQGIFQVGRRKYGFLGATDALPMQLRQVTVEACSTTYVLESPEARLTLQFTSPLLLDDLQLLARPITYIAITAQGRHGRPLPPCTVSLVADETLCLDHAGQYPVEYGEAVGPGFAAGTLASGVQEVLNRSGDDVRIDWGKVYLAVETGGRVALKEEGERCAIQADRELQEGKQVLFALAYDEVEAIQYFGKNLPPYWKKERQTIPGLLELAFAQYPSIAQRCQAFSQDLQARAQAVGGDAYAELLLLAWRQVVAAHTLCEDEAGELLFISKECFSNGCAATVDITYPSSPLFLLYQPELVLGMLRPIFRYAQSPAWPFAFAPHDAGQFPLLNGQVYSGGTDPADQMPVEECGNMLLTTVAATVALDDLTFANTHWDLLTQWANYLRDKGMDPENQLCTDDFAGHLAHNCNLSIKAILGVAAYGLLLRRRGQEALGEEWMQEARSMAAAWVEKASDGNGTYRLAFDQPGTFSMKYNAVWDRLLGLHIFPEGTWDRELASYLSRINPYGMPLDNRAGYTKSDWLVWVASMMDRDGFTTMISHLWDAYDQMPNRIPLGDWFETEDAWQAKPHEFQNRTVQGGLFLPLLYGAGHFQK